MSAPAETLLLVEDEESVRRLVSRVLESAGYRVLQAPAGAGAIGIADTYRGPIHLLITDVTMPDMDGREVARHVTSRRPECRVLFISGYPSQADVPNGGIQDAASYLAKPFVPLALVQRVRDLLRAP